MNEVCPDDKLRWIYHYCMTCYYRYFVSTMTKSKAVSVAKLMYTKIQVEAKHKFDRGIVSSYGPRKHINQAKSK